MNFIKKIVENKVDESIHYQFQKFSKGEFRNKAMIKAKNSGGKYTVNTSAEFANELVREMAEKLGSSKTNVSGGIITTIDLKGKLEYDSIKQFMGIKQYQINREMSGKDIIDLENKFPKAFFALSFKVGEDELKIKAKAPKSGKPSTKTNEAPNPDFCKLITHDKKFADSFILETEHWKNVTVVHTFVIEDIVIPPEFKNEKDFSIVREKARRKGKLIREAVIDDKPMKREIPFEA